MVCFEFTLDLQKRFRFAKIIPSFFNITFFYSTSSNDNTLENHMMIIKNKSFTLILYH